MEVWRCFVLGFRRWVMVLTLLLFAAYLVYRGVYHINWDAPVFALIFFYAELHSFLGLACFYFQIWRPISRSSLECPKGLSVDVFVPTYNEDVDLLRVTLSACVRIRYPHRTLVLDDGNREEVRALAESLGCVYMARGENVDAKAGNLNYGLAHSCADFVVVFDADHVPRPEFLERTLGYFHENSDVGFVQTPQHYYNSDSLCFTVDHRREEALADIDIFYQLIMPGRDYWGAAYFVGTGCVFRRRALDEAGGFARGSITEDLLTSLKIYRCGWASRYHNERLSTGLAPNDLSNYRSQKLRWCSGNVGDLLWRCPFWSSGLTWGQRLSFFSTLLGWLSGIPPLIYFLTPPLVILTGCFPISGYDFTLFGIHCVLLWVLVMGTKVAGVGYPRVLEDVRYNMLNCFSLIQGVWRALLGISQGFQVTSKGRGKKSAPYLLAPQVLIVCASLFAGAFSLGSVWEGNLGAMVASFWAWYHGVVGFALLWGQWSERYQRSEYRLPTQLPVEVRRRQGGEVAALAVDLNGSGVKLKSSEIFDFGEWLHLRFSFLDGDLTCWGRVRYCGSGIYGLSLHALGRGERDRLSTYWFETALPVFNYRYGLKASQWQQWWRRFWGVLRPERRRCMKALTVHLEGELPFLVSAFDVSESGISFVTSRRLKQGQNLRVEMDLGGAIHVFPATVLRQQPLGVSGLFQYGLRYVVPHSHFRRELALDLSLS